MPGIDDPFVLEGLERDLQLVIGPNASGKSTLCRAVRALLWPDVNADERISVTADFHEQDDVLQVARERRKVRWQKNGLEADAPELPGPHVARCFTVGIRDLIALHGETTDAEIALEIGRQMSGGYDLGAVEEACFRVSDRRGANAEKNLGAENRGLQEIKNRQRELAEQESSLLQLGSELESARRARREIDLLVKARDLARARSELEVLNGELGAFPPGMERIGGDEGERLEDLRKDREAAGRRIESCERNIAAAIEEQAGCALPGGAVAQSEMDAWTERARNLERLEAEIRTSRRTRGEAAGRLQAAREAMDPAPPEQGQPRLDADALRGIDAFLDRAARLQKERAGLRAERERLGADRERASRSTIERGIQALRSWLVAAAAKSPAETGSDRKGWLAAAALTLVTGLAALLVEPWLGAALIGLGAGLLAARLRPGGTPATVDDPERHRRDFEQLGLSLPESWSAEEVGRRVRQLEDELAEAVLAERRRAVLQALQAREKELDEQERKHAEERVRIASATGLDPGLDDLTLAVCAQRVSAWTQARGELRKNEEVLRDLERTRSESLRQLNAFIARHGGKAAADAAEATSRVADISSRSDRYRAAERAKAVESEALPGLKADIADLERRAERFWSDLGIERDDDDTLRNRLDNLERFAALTGRAQALRAKTRETEAELTGTPELLRLSMEETGERIARAEQRAARYGELENRRGRIENGVEAARAGDDMERALAAVEAAAGELAEQRDDALRRTAGRFLLRNVRDRYDRESQPEVLQRARELFGRFTHHRYRLLVDEEKDRPTFRALDTVSNTGKPLSELSDATRIQLLLSARIAFANQVERGARLPLFLDEVLTTSDPERFRAVAAVLVSMMRDEERQVFYLSANPADAVHWNEVLSEHGIDPVTPIDLLEVRRLQGAPIDPGAYGAPPLRAVPEPGDLAAEQYAERLGVPRFDPSQPLTRLHLYYLLRDDLALLHSLLRARIETVGQWRAMPSAGGRSALAPGSGAGKLDLRIDLAESFVEHYRIGRGRKIDAEVLQEAGVSSTFLERLAELAGDLGGDAERFMASLHEKRDSRTHRFRDNQREEVHEYLVANGYIDERPVLDESGLRTGVLSAMTRHIQRGAVTAEEVVGRVHELWALAGGK
jgi:hypothetical protein